MQPSLVHKYGILKAFFFSIPTTANMHEVNRIPDLESG